MRKFLTLRLILLALFVCAVPASSFAAVFISVGIAPPVMPVYVQPVCPVDGWMWTPGYWAYDYNVGDYYWVPGAWVPAPAVGMLWTPGYWGFESALYVWHPGYWGPHVGYYGGVNYGFGYMGIGFAGGEWRGGVFAYNTAVVHVDTTIVHTTYVDRTIVERNTIVNDRHVAFSGGPGGINHPPTSAETSAMHEQHMAATTAQTQHVNAAMQDKGSFAKANGGHPATMAVARPMGAGPSSARPGATPAAPMNRGAAPAAGNAGNRPAYGAPGGTGAPNEQRPAQAPAGAGSASGREAEGAGRPGAQPAGKPAAKPAPKEEKRDER